MIYYDAKDKRFKFLSRAYQDYSASAEFLVFTTTGHLSLADRTTDVFTTPYKIMDNSIVLSADASMAHMKSYYSNVVYTYKKTPESETDLAHVDCETAASTAMQCIEKGDYVMILDTNETHGRSILLVHIFQIYCSLIFFFTNRVAFTI